MWLEVREWAIQMKNKINAEFEVLFLFLQINLIFGKEEASLSFLVVGFQMVNRPATIINDLFVLFRLSSILSKGR